MILVDDGDVLNPPDREGRVQHTNRRALELFGLNPMLSVESKTLIDALPESRLRDIVMSAASYSDESTFKDVDLSTEQKHHYVRVASHPVNQRPRRSDAVSRPRHCVRKAEPFHL